MYFYYIASDESGSPGSFADIINGAVGGAVGGALMLIIVVVCATVIYIRQSCKKRTNATKKQVMHMESVNMASNPSYSMNDQDENTHQQENSDVHNDMYDAITMDANPSYGRPRELDTTANGITTEPMSDVIQPHPSHSFDSDEDRYCYVNTSEIQHHHSVDSTKHTSYLQVISATVTNDSVNNMHMTTDQL